MPVYSFHCPHCSTLLRLKDRRLIGRTINCPDCHQAVEIQDNQASGIVGRPSASGKQVHSDPGANVERGTGRLRRWLAAAGSPLGAAWIVAGLLSTGLLAWIVTSPPTGSARSQTTVSKSDVDVAADPSPDRADEHDAESIKGRLRNLYGLLSSHWKQNGTWPRGSHENPSLPDSESLSWLATIAAPSQSNGPQPHWDRAWNDPLNARFVRQRKDEFLNPLIDQQTGDNRYPASHFVGITGHGVDSELLPGDHPRAGIFGVNRETSPDDVTDGLANTMMLAGVDRQLGSWAATGPSTLRGFTTEPYINGPDGFGTGQADGMTVLMADGSVRFLSSKTDPDLIRRMAAKADGLPLDVSVPDVPKIASQPDLPPNAPPEDPKREPPVNHDDAAPDRNANPFEITDLVAELAGGVEQPIEVPLADAANEGEEGTGIDVATMLQQPIIRFDQSTPVPARQLLRSLEEMLAISFGLDQLPESIQRRLEQPVTVTLAETTSGDILIAVLQQLGLQYHVHENRITITIAETEETP